MRLRPPRQLLVDIFLLAGTPVLALAIRVESFRFSDEQFASLLKYTVGALVLRIATNVAFGVYGALWRYASALDLSRLLAGVLVSSALCIVHGGVLIRLLPPPSPRLPLAVLLLDFGLAAVAIIAPRLWFRLTHGTGESMEQEGMSRALIVGAGRLGQLLLQDLRMGAVNLFPVGLVDDATEKIGRRLAGVPVVGTVAEIPALIRRLRADTIVIAIRYPNGGLVRGVLDAASNAGITAKVVPSPGEVAAGNRSVSGLRTVNIEDLLRRQRVQSDEAGVQRLIAGQTVLVTGAGGTIGSELAMQCARWGPKKLVLLDHDEDGVYQIDRRLRHAYPGLCIIPLVMDVRDRARVHAAFLAHSPDLVYHAAAYKHVPLMEVNLLSALINNVGGTLELFDVAEQCKVQRVVTISSDKAVEPSSMMGLTKLVTELMMRRQSQKGHTVFSGVRFGNVLGSRGSVVPLFLEQIQGQRRITVTHPEMSRYFMLTSEAAGLVLQASVHSSHGDIFVLDMGMPVRILDLATDLIRLSGLVPHEDVEIVFTGLRPGEKMHEALTASGEALEPTSVAGVSVIRRATDPLDSEDLRNSLTELAEELMGQCDDTRLLKLAQELAMRLELSWSLAVGSPENTT